MNPEGEYPAVDGDLGRRFSLLLAMLALPLAGTLFLKSTACGCGIGVHTNLPLHAVLEAQGGLACLAMAVMLIFLNAPKEGALRNANIILASSFIVSGAFDTFHATLTTGTAFVWLRTVATCGGGLLMAALALPRRRPLSGVLPAVAFVAALAIGACSLAFPEKLPAMLDHGRFTPTAVVLNLVGGLGYLMGAARLFRGGDIGRFPLLLIATLVLFGSAGLLFTTSALWRADWWWWHIVRYAGSLVLLAQFALQARGLQRRLAADRDMLEARVHERTSDLDVARRAAEDANRAKSAFLAAMSHEIRTPMNAILNMVGSVLESPLDVTQKEHLKVADSSARHLLSIINDILDFSKIESGKLEIENIPFSLHGLLESVADLFRTKVAETGVELVFDINPDVPDGVRGDPTRLRQILVNLVGNAIKFTPEGQIVLRAEPHGTGLRFLLADTGIGIPADRQDKLFQPFTQAESSTSRRYGGTGLGLAISRRLAELMGGQITFSSVEGEGTVFMVDLPLPPVTAGNDLEVTFTRSVPTAGQTVPEAESFAGTLALLAEDNLQNQLVAKMLLKKLGITIEIAANGKIAVEMARAAPDKYNIILMDMQMPEMDGLEATRKIRESGADLPALARIPIIAMTANAMKSDLNACIEAGMNGWITKPIDKAVLRTELEKALTASARETE